MRMWMVDPSKMCRFHLIGEHFEHHMFLGSLKKEKDLKGYIEKDLLEPLSLKTRHDALAKEMIARGYNHKSPLDFDLFVLAYMPDEYICHKINKKKSQNDLFSRCSECNKK